MQAQAGSPTPTPTPTPSTFRDVAIIAGAGSLVSGHFTNYKIQNTNQIIEAQNLGRATPQLLTGLSFGLPIANFHWGCNKFDRYDSENKETKEYKRCVSGWNELRHPWHAIVSLKLTPNTNNVLNGFVIGPAYRLSHHFALMVGLSYTPSDEPSPGFVNAAVQTVKANSEMVPIYKNFNADDMKAGKPNAFDGFPLFVQSPTGPTATQVYLGDPLITRYRPGLVISVTFPISQLTGATGGTQ